MLDRLIDDVNKALDAGAYFAALTLALTIPDICAKAEYGDSFRNNKKRYVKWFDTYIGKYEICPGQDGEDRMSYLSGEVVYSLRNNMLHQGTPNINKDKIIDDANKIDEFSLVIEGKNEFDIYSDFASLTKECFGGQIKSTRTYDVNVQRLCLIICLAAKKMYEANKDKFSFFNFRIIDRDKEKQ